MAAIVSIALLVGMGLQLERIIETNLIRVYARAAYSVTFTLRVI